MELYCGREITEKVISQRFKKREISTFSTESSGNIRNRTDINDRIFKGINKYRRRVNENEICNNNEEEVGREQESRRRAKHTRNNNRAGKKGNTKI